MASRKSVANKSESKSGWNYQKEVKQLKKDIRLRDDRISLLNKDTKYKQDTIDLLQTGMKNKDEQLQLKDKELMSYEQNVKLLSEKTETLEKHNEEMKNESEKQSKLANQAQKKLNIAEQNNMNLLTQINSLAQNLNNLKNVNMALSSQLTMTMSAAQNNMNSMHTLSQITDNQNNNNNNNNKSDRESIDDNINDNNNDHDHTTNNDASDTDEEDTKSDDNNDAIAELPDIKRMKPAKKRQSMIPQSKTNITIGSKSIGGRKRSKSGGSKKDIRDSAWDSTDQNEKEKEKVKRRNKNRGDKDKDKEKPPPQISKQKSSSSRQSRSISNAKRLRKQQQQMELSEDDHWDGDIKKNDAANDNDFFGNAPVEKKKKKKKNKQDHDKNTTVCFDTYLSEIESDKLKITKNGKLVAMDYFTDSLYIISSVGYATGKHEWEIKTLKTGDLTDEIGICSSWDDLEVNGNGIADMGSKQLSARAVYANDPSTGVAFHDAYDDTNKLIYDKKFKKKGNNKAVESWAKGDIIKVALNLNRWQVKFYLNNKQVGKSIPLTKDLTYYPILCAYGSCSYQVVSCS